MAERKSIYFPDEILPEISLRIGQQSRERSGVVTSSLGWYFRLLDYVGISEMAEVFTAEEVAVIVRAAAKFSLPECCGLASANAALVAGLAAHGAGHNLVRKVRAFSPFATIWLLDRMATAQANPDMDTERLAALFMVDEPTSKMEAA